MAKPGKDEMKGKGKTNNSFEEKRNTFIEENLQNIPEDNRRFLERIRERFDRVGMNLPKVEVRFKNLHVEANCQIVYGKPLPTLFNALKSSIYGPVNAMLKIFGVKFREAKITILKDVSGIIKPSRMTLLLGPPGCGKTTLLRALAGMLDHSLKVEGEVSYNGFRLDEFIPQKTSAYISQHDLHISEMTVRETLDFSARCQGVRSRAELLKELEKREKEAGIVADFDLDAYMKAIAVDGLERSPQTDYILKILGLEICSDVIVGDAMRRGISGGEKKRVTLGEMIAGPSRTFFMDEISNGLDSSSTFQIIACLQQMAHIMETTILVSLLQPAPEVFNLFDEIILMAEGTIIYHGPRHCVLEFFENCGFRCPERKSPADFLHEVISKKDQAQFWCHSGQQYHYVPVEQFAERFKAFSAGQKLSEELSRPHCMLKGAKDALSFTTYSLSKRELFKACCSREWILVKRNPVVYVLKMMQLMFLAFVTMTVFMRTQMSVDQVHANYYMGALCYTLLLLMVNNNPELYLTLSRLAVFYKQRDSYFYPGWAFSLPSSVLKIPHSLVASLFWTLLTYYVIGYSPEAGRFFCQFLLFFAVHLMSASMQRAIAAVFRTFMAATTVMSFSILISLSFGGFILPLSSIPAWMTWGFWVFPLSYAEIGVTVNEFHAPRWRLISSANVSVGEQVMRRRGLLYESYFYWISLGALFGFIVILNTVFILALTFLKSPSRSRAVITFEKLSQLQGKDDCNSSVFLPISSMEQKRGKVTLPFEPLALSFQGVQYFVDMPRKMKSQGMARKNIQLLRDVTGAFRPHVLTALMGVSGAGKTTLLDVLSGRKTFGTIQGDIRIGGYPKVQETFARISGYCEQNDIHSPHITVEESVIHSAWLRLGPQINEETKMEFVNEVLETVELDEIKDTLVGIPGVSGLSIEQRKRLTLAVELVSNPSIMFIDEPTSGLDARTAAIVMRAVKNVVGTGRTVVSTIHQPSIDIFESFDEIILIKKGGQIIYSGQLGWHSERVINYFESIQGVPKIEVNANPATWMLEITSASVERQLGIDFAQVYKESSLYQDTKMLVEQLSKPTSGSKKLRFSTRFSVNVWGQFTACLWKHWLSYWRSPDYNLKRISFAFFSSLFFGLLFWNHGSNINTEQDLFHMAGFMFCAIVFPGILNCNSVQHLVVKERLVMYRERFVGMYSSHVYSLAQIAIEIPYVFMEAVVFGSITYWAVGFHLSAYKFLWYFGALFSSLLSYTYMGMLIISVSSSTKVSNIYSSTFFTMSNLFAGFMIPRPVSSIFCFLRAFPFCPIFQLM
ncbi:pleiotropic drug resistance protein 3-like isoform X1 [Magnolia sinica]|uniref:pleiotropic drug resistance protein 3-like isoform X1 n=3 Tax=Magnolia sinica TaxID=86752 RepID=UPI00265AC035|nr:pleiotropic drug resistance protein 3-like isoform X1 [Magnolia sinica]